MSQPTGTAKKKILIVDDEQHVVTYLETLLQDNGFDTLSASDGKAAMERVKSERPDLVCLDITMPVQSGIRFYRDLKENPQFTSIPVIVVTAVTGFGGDPEPFEKFLGSRKQVPPPEGFFSKPIDRDKFLETVKKILS
jgi:CheY-like chemotaxis protein